MVLKNGLMKNLLKRTSVQSVVAAVVLLSPAFADDCEDLSALQLQNAELVSAETMAAGVFNFPNGESYDLPEHCKVRGVAKPTPQSSITFEVWMPTRNWNGRYRQTGGGGFSGRIYYGSMADGLTDGNAVAATDDGHIGGGPWPEGDASWALGQPEKIIDYAYRSIEATAVSAKILVNAYYGKPPEWSYFFGCSTGGRQALKAAQRFPDEWDGILAVAPALRFVETLVGFASSQRAQWGEGGTPISHSKLPAIQNAALAACTSGAHAVDGVAADPRLCRFDPTSLLCEGENNDSCLTPGEAATLSTIYDGPLAPKSRKRLVAGFEPTTEAVGVAGDPSGSGWKNWVISAAPGYAVQYIFAQGFLRYFVLDDPDWDLRDFDMAEHGVHALKKKIKNQLLSKVLNATDPDLSDLKKGGGKLLITTGWAEEALPPQVSIDYYEAVQKKMGGDEIVREFLRLFMVPGMQHCGGGPGANALGQSKLFAPALKNDARHDLVRALEAWVEKGVAPEQLIATKYVNNHSQQGVAFTRPVCVYPNVPAYKGAGSQDLAENFECIDPTGE